MQGETQAIPDEIPLPILHAIGIQVKRYLPFIMQKYHTYTVFICKYPDDKLRKLISHFNSPDLRNSDLEKEDVFGDAYEYLLGEFAEETKKKGGEFFTPREIVWLLVNLVEPKEGMKICRPRNKKCKRYGKER